MITLGTVAIIGGGCYGTFYTGQLESARAKGAVDYHRLLLIDRDPACKAATLAPDSGRDLLIADWGQFLDDWLDPSARDQGGRIDTIVPSPMMPHLMANWLERRARERWAERTVALVPAEAPLGTPYDRLHTDGVRYVSFADWLCPTHCVEPLLCPAIKGPRTWEMGDAVADWTAERNREHPTAGPALFTCRHAVYGVGMYPAHAAFEGLEALAAVADLPTGGDLVIGSVSACHGAIAVLRVGPEPGWNSRCA